MRTFKGTLSLDFKAIFTEQHLQDMREAACAQDATPFLKQVQLTHPRNDDAFLSAILKNAVRGHTRDSIVVLFNDSGVGGTVSPVSISIIEVPEAFGGSVQPIVIDKAIEAPFAVPAEVLPVNLIAEEL